MRNAPGRLKILSFGFDVPAASTSVAHDASSLLGANSHLGVESGRWSALLQAKLIEKRTGGLLRIESRV